MRPWDWSRLGLGLAGFFFAVEFMQIVQRHGLLDVQRWRDDRKYRRLIAELSTAYAHAPSTALDDVLTDSLERIGRAFAMHRVGILQGTKADGSLRFTHRWSMRGVPPFPPAMRAIDLPALTRSLLRGKTVRVPCMVIVPMSLDDRSAAGLWLGSDGPKRQWTKPLMHRLHEVATVVASALRLRSAIAERHNAESMTADILDCLSAQVAILDSGGTIVRVNDAWRRFADRYVRVRSGLDVGASYVETWRAISSDNDEMARNVLLRVEAALSGSDTGGPIEYVCHAPDTDQTFEIEVVPLRRPEGGAVIVQHDETSRKQVEIEVQQRRRDAAHFARVATISGLAASLAHELNQPLTAIRSNAQTAQHYVGRLPRATADMQSVLADIVADVDRAGQIIDRVRGLLQNRPLAASAIDLNDLVRDVIKLLSTDAALRRASLVPALDSRLVTIQADRVQIQQVVLNLMLNALEAIDRAGRSERRVTAITRQVEATWVQLSVRDTGPGLGPNATDRFEPFRSTKEHGLGLGLSISRMIVEAHGGSLEAENNDTGGATFHVILPTHVGTVS